LCHLDILVQTQHYKPICCWCLYKFDQVTAVSHLALSKCREANPQVIDHFPSNFRSGSEPNESNVKAAVATQTRARDIQKLSPASEHAADQAAWTATATTAVMVSTTPAATTGQMVVIGFVAAAGAGMRR
jgi:hypothetical protein